MCVVASCPTFLLLLLFYTDSCVYIQSIVSLTVTQTSRRYGIAEDASRIASSIVSRNLSPNPKQAKKDDAKVVAPAKDKKTAVSFTCVFFFQ